MMLTASQTIKISIDTYSVADLLWSTILAVDSHINRGHRSGNVLYHDRWRYAPRLPGIYFFDKNVTFTIYISPHLSWTMCMFWSDHRWSSCYTLSDGTHDTQQLQTSYLNGQRVVVRCFFGSFFGGGTWPCGWRWQCQGEREVHLL